MASVTLTNLIVNGSFESNVNSWNGYYTDNKDAQGTVNPTRQTVSPSHGETGGYCLQIGNKTQGVVYTNPSAAINTIVGHKYYIKAQVKLRGVTAGVVSVCTAINGTSVPLRGAAPPPLAEGLQTTNTSGWDLIDAIWTADITSLNLRFIFQTTANQGNNDVYGQVDNVVMIDLTQSFGVGLEPPLFGIRDGIANYTTKGWFDSTTGVTMPVAPIITTQSLNPALKGRNYSSQISLETDTGSAPFSFIISGLPVGHGLSVDGNGTMSGVCNLSEGNYNMTITVTDNIGYQVGKSFQLVVAEPPVINDTFIPGAILNVPYSFTPDVSGSNGNLVVSMAVTSGSLPTGLSISGGSITGTPTVDGQICQVTITAYNDYDSNGVTRVLTLGVYSAPNISTQSPLKNATLNAAYSLQFVAAGVTPITWEHLTGSLPPGLELSEQGLLSGTTSQVGLYSFSIKATNTLGSDTQLFSLNVYELPIITTDSFGYARLGSSYSAQLSATGSTPITWAITSGGLPTGLSLNQTTGQITGTPMATGTFIFTVVATNVAGNSVPVQLTIDAGLALSITTTSPLPSGTLNSTYTPVTFRAEGVDGSYTTTWGWAAQAGSSLPPGLTFNTTTGVLSGTPSSAGVYNIIVTVTNGSTNSTTPFTITIGAPPVITTSPSLTGGVNRPFTAVLSASGTAPITWNMVGSPVWISGPGGPPQNIDITISSTGVVSWLVAIESYYEFTAVATNTFGNSVPVVFSLTITTPSIIDVLLDNGILGDPYYHQFSAGGEPPFTWSLMSGSIPTGLIFNPTTAVLSGTPSATGTFNFQLRVTNLGGFAQEPFTITVQAKPIITNISLNSGNVSAAYSQSIQTTGTTPITLSVVTPSGSETGLPPGLSLSGSTISGTPSTAGVYTFSLKASNVTGSSYDHIKEFSITIGSAGSPVITTGSSLSASKDVPYSLQLNATGNTPITWSLDNSSLPTGLQLVDDTISGTPTGSGTYQFTIAATNNVGTDYRTFTMIIPVPPAIITYTLPFGVENLPYSELVEAIGDPPITWSIVAISGSETGLPIGLSLNSNTGLISGIPTEPGTFTFTIKATNTFGSNTFPLEIFILNNDKTFLDGNEVKALWVEGNEVEEGYVNGIRVYKAIEEIVYEYETVKSVTLSQVELSSEGGEVEIVVQM